MPDSERKYIRLPIPGQPSYFADNDGNIWSEKRGHLRMLLMPINSHSYRHVNFCQNKIVKDWKVHQLIALTFHGPCPEGKQVRHYPDGDKLNNTQENIKYGTPAEDGEDRKRLGQTKQQDGEDNSSAKLNDNAVREIRFRYQNGETQQQIADSFGVSHSLISGIVRRIRWPHVK